MADFDPAQDAGFMDSDTAAPGAAARVGTALNVLGAAASLALVAGVALWGYKLVMRDVSGVPVVRAVEGPMREAPADPGGRPADHQGLAVNAVAARGSAEAPAERLVLAPRPVDLLAEDKPLPVIAAAAAEPDPAAHDIDSDVDIIETVADEDVADEAPEPADTMQAMVNQLIAEVLPGEAPAGVAADGPKIVKVSMSTPVAAAPMQESVAELVEDAEDDAEPVIAAVITGPGLKRSPRPQTRPAELIQAALVMPAVDAPVRDVDPDSIPAGTRLAQLGAFESREVAEQEWERLNGRFADYLDGKDRVIQKATSGGRTFYRLRAMGFDDLNDTRRFCSALVAEKADCIPVAAR